MALVVAAGVVTNTVGGTLSKAQGTLYGDGSATQVSVTHGLTGTILGCVCVDGVGNYLVPTLKATSSTVLQLTFAVAPAAGSVLSFLIWA